MPPRIPRLPSGVADDWRRTVLPPTVDPVQDMEAYVRQQREIPRLGGRAGTPEFDTFMQQFTPPAPPVGMGSSQLTYQREPSLPQQITGSGLAPIGSPQWVQQQIRAGVLPRPRYASGGLTTGRGDGMSDEIMTTIAGQQQAALSPGEFVVPADVVSGIGNGDTNSGAKRLYAMMDNIRGARTGKTKQPQRINPRLPT